MKYYPEMAKLGCFTTADVVRMTGNEVNAQNICRRYVKKGWVQRVKREMYVAIDLATGQPIVNKFIVASKASEDAVIAYHSAFEYYGYVNQVYYEMYVASNIRFRDFSFDGYTIRQVSPRIQGHVQKDFNGITVTNRERTVIDSIALIGKIGGLEELFRCIELIPHLDEQELISCLQEYDNKFLWQKTGFVLSYYAKTLGISATFLEECHKHIPEGITYLSRDHGKVKLDNNWRICVPDLDALLQQGM